MTLAAKSTLPVSEPDIVRQQATSIAELQLRISTLQATVAHLEGRSAKAAEDRHQALADKCAAEAHARRVYRDLKSSMTDLAIERERSRRNAYHTHQYLSDCRDYQTQIRHLVISRRLCVAVAIVLSFWVSALMFGGF